MLAGGVHQMSDERLSLRFRLEAAANVRFPPLARISSTSQQNESFSKA
jgi:hypothetical protein